MNGIFDGSVRFTVIDGIAPFPEIPNMNNTNTNVTLSNSDIPFLAFNIFQRSSFGAIVIS